MPLSHCRKEFKTKHGRVVRDGGGIEADVVSPERKASALEIALLVQVGNAVLLGHQLRLPLPC